MGGIYVGTKQSQREWTSSEGQRLQFIAELFANSIFRKHQEQELETTRSMLMASFKSSPAGIVVVDAPDGRLLTINQSMINAHDVATDEVSGMTLQEYYRDRQWYNAQGDYYSYEDLPLARAILRGETSKNVDLIFERDNGGQRWLLVSSAPVRNASGDVVAGVGVNIDVTELKQTAAEREKLILELEEKNAELERFTYTVSHDLKSPIITIKGFLGLLQKELEQGDLNQALARIQKVNAASDQMSRLLDELLALSRIGRKDNTREHVSVTQLAKQAIELIGSTIESEQVQIVIETDLPEVFVDRIRMVEVFQNLIDNAVRFAGESADPRIQVGMEEKDDKKVFYVFDNGAGIAPEYHDKVFGLFEQLEPQFGGTGVGLAIVKRIVEVHGGTIWIESDGRENGTKFCFTIPSSTEGDNKKCRITGSQ